MLIVIFYKKLKLSQRQLFCLNIYQMYRNICKLYSKSIVKIRPSLALLPFCLANTYSYNAKIKKNRLWLYKPHDKLFAKLTNYYVKSFLKS